MVGITPQDTCFSTIQHGILSRLFNTDGKKRTELDIAEVRKALDFNIVKKQSYDEKGRKLIGNYHLVREDTDAIIPSLGIGGKFVPVQHYVAFDNIVNQIMPKISGMRLETVGTLHGCGTGLIMATIGDDFHIAGDESANRMRLIFSNPCNGTGRLVLGFTTVRLMCQNQIAAARKQALRNDGFAIQHTKNASIYVDSAVQSILSQMEQAKSIKLKSEQLASVEINTAFVDRMINAIYPFRFKRNTAGYTRNANLQSEVLTQFEGGETAMSMKKNTAWKLFNAFSFPIFNPTHMGNRIDSAEIAYSGAVGDRADKVLKIFNSIYEEARRIAA